MKKTFSLLLCLILAIGLALSVFAGDTAEKPYDNSALFEVGDYTLHYRVYEPEEKAQNQILLIHGFCLSTASLEGLAEEYRKAGYRVVTVDVPNFGYSSRETANTALLSREEVIFSLMENLGGTWVVGGHSMGGGIAINLACEHQDKVTGLVLFAPQTSAELPASVGKVMSHPLMGKVFDVMIAAAVKCPPLVRLLVAMSFSDMEYAKDYDLDRITKPISAKGTGTGITIMTSHAKGSDLEAFSALQIPTVIVRAQNDLVASPSNLEAIVNNAPETAVVIQYGTGGHMMMEYSPAIMAKVTRYILEN